MTVSVFPGFLHASCQCPYCGHEWEYVVAIGMTGAECPRCHAREDDYVWLPTADESQPDMSHDGCWLTGNLPELWILPAAQWRSPWWRRFIAWLIDRWRARQEG